MGISINSESTNKRFAAKVGVEFPLLSDTRRAVSKQYGVLNFFRVAKRTTFAIDKEGVVRHSARGLAAADPESAAQACRLINQKP